MPRKAKALSDALIQSLQPTLKPRKVRDGDTPGLHLLIGVSGRKSWRFRYQKGGREYVMTLGRYEPKMPTIHMTLKGARAEAYRLASELEAGGHPADDKKRAALPDEITFEYAARDYLERYFAGKLTARAPAPSTIATTRRAFRACEPLHDRAIDQITPPEFRAVIDALVDMDKRQSAVKVRQFLNKLCGHAYSMGWLARNPIRDLPPPPTPDEQKRPALTDPRKFGKLLRLIDGFDGHPTIHVALQVLPHLFVRPGELRLATFGEIDFTKSLWTIPAARTKQRREHKVPLSKQAWDLLADHSLNVPCQAGDYVFPSTTHRERAMSENTLNYALRSLGVDTKTVHCAHGFRSSAMTLLAELRTFDGDIVDLCLGHAPKDRVRERYDRSELLDKRAKVMQGWSDYIDRLRAGKKRKA